MTIEILRFEDYDGVSLEVETIGSEIFLEVEEAGQGKLCIALDRKDAMNLLRKLTAFLSQPAV